MTVHATRLRHGLLVGVALVAVALAAFLISTRGAGYPNPADGVRPLHELAARSQAERDFERLIFGMQCLDALTRNKYAPALQYCDLGLSQNADDAMLLKLRGNANFFLGKNKAAIADFSRVARIVPHDPDAYRFRGTVYASMHRDALALADFNHAVAVAPSDPVSLEFRGFFLETRGKYNAAIVDFLASIALQPNNYHAWNSLCWTRFLAGANGTQALAACNRAVELNARYVNSYDSRGFVLIRLGRYQAAIVDFGKALSINPKLASSWFGRGIAKAHVGDRTAARDIATARLMAPGIDKQFLAYGIRVPTVGPPGT